MEHLRLLLAGDVMTGRGVDQVMPHPVAPQLYEPWIRDARDYVRLVERKNGAIPAPVAPDYIWGDALAEMGRAAADVRIVNLETAVTTAGTPCARKDIHYRMSPDHVGCLTAAGIDACVLANNHVLDWGVAGLQETLRTLHQAGLQTAGAGMDRQRAWAPAVLPLPSGGRLLLFAWAVRSSGAPADWAAAAEGAGVAWLAQPDEAAAQQVIDAVTRERQPGDLVVVSLHWGGNWVLEVPDVHRRFAYRLIEAGAADVVHGHSSHHPLPAEVHAGRLILYGCGDLINDYEAIRPCGELRSDLGCLYVATLAWPAGSLCSLEIVPRQLQRLRLSPPQPDALRWLLEWLNAAGKPLGTRIEPGRAGRWWLRWKE